MRTITKSALTILLVAPFYGQDLSTSFVESVAITLLSHCHSSDVSQQSVVLHCQAKLFPAGGLPATTPTSPMYIHINQVIHVQTRRRERAYRINIHAHYI